MKKFSNPEVAAVFASYPKNMRKHLMYLRQLVFDAALETDGVGEIEETLKWGEPSYLVKGGSTIRMDWKKKNPDYYAVYFNCKTSLIDTFKELYRDKFKFEGNRVIIFSEHDQVPDKALKHCFSLSLTYHKIKNLPLLGA